MTNNPKAPLAPIIEVLCGYVRLNGPPKEVADSIRLDVQAALDVATQTRPGRPVLDLQDANLAGASLNSADLSDSRIRNASFSGAVLVGANFSQAKGVRCLFQSCQLKNARFVKADLVQAEFNKAELEGTDFSGAFLEKADLRRRNLTVLRNLTEQIFRRRNSSTLNPTRKTEWKTNED